MIHTFVWRQLQPKLHGPWGERISGEIEFLRALDVTHGDRDKLIDEAIALLEAQAADGGVGEPEVHAAERILEPLREEARRITVLAIAHAHIDMNWMWGYDETVVITVETMRTMLRLLDEYPQFRFSQSQGSVYRIIQEFAPELLPAITEHVRAGRWEPAATQWTETDMNLPSTESLLQHVAQTTSFLKDLLGVDREQLQVAFMPDTFGHGVNTPELLAEAGVKYVYHCRGQKGPYVSRWRAPSGRSVLAYQDPRWYNERVLPAGLGYASMVAAEYGIPAVPWVYGVGDHGGGPTRRDIAQILRMQQWPLAPTVEFGTYHELFRRLESVTDLPVCEGERNPVFTGCYTSQQRIKEASRRCERALYAATLLDATGDAPPADFTEAWRTTLFNHFHDILPGSGVAPTREHALGSAQHVLARTTTSVAASLRALMRRLVPHIAETVHRLADRYAGGQRDGTEADPQSEGAGVGFGSSAGGVGGASRWRGWVRPFLIVNPLPFARSAVTPLTVWDWPEAEPPQFVDADGTPLPMRIVRRDPEHYWGHDFFQAEVLITMQSFGYDAVYAVPADKTNRRLTNPYGVDEWLVDTRSDYVLDNGRLRATVRQTDFTITELVDLQNGRNLLGSEGAAFVIEYEEAGHMTSWTERAARRGELPGARGRLTGRSAPQETAPWMSWEAPFGSSRISVTYGLDPQSDELTVTATVAFREISTAEVPRLRFRVGTPLRVANTVSDVPGGTITRAAGPLSVAAQRFIAVSWDDDAHAGVLALISPNAQGLGGADHELWAVLLRGSNDPDPAPDIGDHSFRLVLRGYDRLDTIAIGRDAAAATQPLIAAPFDPLVATVGEQTLRSLPGQLVDARQQGTELFSLARPRAGVGILLRLGAHGRTGSAEYRFPLPVSAILVDAQEAPVTADAAGGVSVNAEGTVVRVHIPKRRVCSVLIQPRR